eukprot:GHVU01028863.1.p1 GENE.GHVU01028863.1~~GHVU01028863.1.p1  ORF type:complete len:202 (+),score=24.37 GHVU01028863.1:543-1148(+)
MDVLPRKVEPLSSPFATEEPGWACAAMTKLRIWELCEFDKLVYIDSDCVVVGDVAELFERPSPAFAADIVPPDKFNAGVIVLRPDASVFADMVARLPTLPSHDGGDTGYLNSYFPDWYSWAAAHRLSFGYNAQRLAHWFTSKKPSYWNSIQPLKIIHYSSSPKPWENGLRRGGDLEVLWWQLLVDSCTNGQLLDSGLQELQ